MPKDEGNSGGDSKPGKKTLAVAVPASLSKSSSLAMSDDRIDPMIDPQSTDPLDFPMALFDPVTVNTHEKERKQRQTVNTLNDIYKQVSRFDDIFIEPPFEIEPKAKLTSEPDLSYENIKIMLSLYDWFAAAVFDVEACQLAMSDEDMLSSSEAMIEARTFMRDRLRKLQTIKNDIQEKCYVMRTFLRKKTEVADEMFKELGISNVVNRPPPPSKFGATRAKAAAAAADAAATAAPEAPPPVVMSWRQAAKSVAEDLKRAKAEGFFEFIETEEKFKIVMAIVEKQDAKIKELISNQKALQASIHSLSASGHNMTSDGPHAGRRESSKAAGLKALSEFNDRILKLLKQAAESIKLSNGEESKDDEELLKNIDTELNYARKMMESASMKSLADASSKHSSLDETRSIEKMKVGETLHAAVAKLGEANAPSTTAATVNNAVAAIPEEAKKDKKAKKTKENKEKKKEVAKKK